jgi:hypothetical protein
MKRALPPFTLTLFWSLFALAQQTCLLAPFAAAQTAPTTYIAVSGSQSYHETKMGFALTGNLSDPSSLDLTFQLNNTNGNTCYSGSVCPIQNGNLTVTFQNGSTLMLNNADGQMDTGTVSRPGSLDVTAVADNGTTQYEVKSNFTLRRNCYRTCGAPTPVFTGGGLTVTQ